MKISNFQFPISNCCRLGLLLAAALPSLAGAETTLLYNAIVHTGSGQTFTNGGVVMDGERILMVLDGRTAERFKVNKMVDLKRQHLYPGLIALDTALGLAEIEAVRATQDAREVGDYTPDSELLPVARANGIAYFEPAPEGGVVSGQSALLAMAGWTYEQMTVKKPVALHVFWPKLALDTTPKEYTADKSKWKSLDDQDKKRRAKLRALADFFEEARAYAKARDAATSSNAPAPEKIPAWEAMLPCVRGDVPLVIHADEVRQIQSAVEWAATNHFKAILAGGRDAWMVAGLLATNKIPVIYERVFTKPVRDTESYDTHFNAPAALRQAGVTVVFGMRSDNFDAALVRNLPYAAAQAIAFGLPEAEALKGLTLYPAQLLGVADRVGSIEFGKQATLFVSDGNIFDPRANVKRMWIAGKEVNLDSRHTRLYEKYKNRPKLNR
jgi:imidazolonepropionase-like amidohydrolase